MHSLQLLYVLSYFKFSRPDLVRGLSRSIAILKLLTLPVPILDEEKKFKFLFLHFFVVPQKVLWRPFQPAWDVSERSQSDLHWERYLRDLSETSQKICLFCDVFKTSQKHLKKDFLCVTSLRRLAHISKKKYFPWRLWDVSKTSLASIFAFPKICH